MDIFGDVATNPLEWIREWKQTHDKRIIGCLPMSIPEELIAASDMLPIALPGSNAHIGKANTHLATYICHPVKGNFESSLNRDYDFLDGVVFADLCDQTKRIGNIWEIYTAYGFTFHMRLPKRLDSELAADFYQEELTRFRSALERFSGNRIDDTKIWAAIKLYNDVRNLISELYCLRKEHPGSFAASELFNILLSAMVMPKAALKSCLTQYLSSKEIVPDAAATFPRLLLAGNPCESTEPGILEMISDAGGVIVDDYVYSGSMYLSGRVPESTDPIKALVQGYFDSPPCPTKHDIKRNWGDYLVTRAKEDKADGVVMVLPKYCEVFAFEYPDVRQKLTEAGIPHLKLEVMHTGADARLKIRLEAFIEMLR